ncbi:uncharacterized protein LOC126891731 [Diabrotica virgifera virgifera]|uniref:DUF7869 domain-containing protein n=1 Tax=Diabrotica virgifera virgifera TaxID=50390 RepID=A0ABM5L3E8_DIAVI|nr:uncharacterized protein LOC126891731 [Diabrotica virgifera virgifera]
MSGFSSRWEKIKAALKKSEEKELNVANTSDPCGMVISKENDDGDVYMRLETNSSFTGMLLNESVEYTLDSYETPFVPELGYNDPCCSNNAEQNFVSEYLQSAQDEPIIIQELTSSSTVLQPTSWLSEYVESAEDEPKTIQELTSPSMSFQPEQHKNSNSTDGILFSEDQNSNLLVKPTNEDGSDDELIEDPHYIPESNTVLMTNENTTRKRRLERKRSRQQLEKLPDTRKARELRKKNRNSGKSYVTKKGKIIPERPFQTLPLCRAKCKTKITESQLKEIFSEYWSLGSYDKRAAYIASLFTIHDKKSHRPRTDDPDKEKYRLKTNKYFLRINGSHISVCQLPPEVTHVVLYSDTCGGQNKNSHISSMIMSILQRSDVNVQVVDHKFMVPGHTHMEVDVAHSMIEKKKKRSNIAIFLPHDWYQLVRSTSV